MPPRELLAHLSDTTTSLVIVSDGGMPEIVHWGAFLGTTPIDLNGFDRPIVGGGLDVDPPVGIVTEAARGWFGRPGLEGSRSGGRDFAPQFALRDASATDRMFTASLADGAAELELELRIELDAAGVLRFDTTLRNVGPDTYHLQALRLSLPLPAAAEELLTVGGRHNHEFVQHRTPWQRQCVTVENRHGKTSHERLGVVFAGSTAFGEHRGDVWGVHLGWSGNYEIVCDAVTDARRLVQVGELLLAGEVDLASGAEYAMPSVYAAYASEGLNPVSTRFHSHLRARPGHPTLPRPVHLNTWEAVYFDHDLATLRSLADTAAGLGIERFVLDDGWFGSRRDDTSGLGDWTVSGDAWPDGLAPIIDHVRGLGMEFGIWVEPEMVNPDSDLHRAHPDWALVDPRYPVVLGRNQLVLDLGRPEVREHLFGRLDALLRDHDIAYVKWDHNRDLVAPSSLGRAGVHTQTLGAYELLDRLRAAHPGVDFETCASGGGRVDFGILERSDRVWTSDSNDALDRHEIQRGFSLLFPPELMGSHIGPTHAHTTWRTHSMGFRGVAALFGSLGVECNVLALSDDERAELASIIALHKQHRALLHSGSVYRADHPDPTVDVHGVIAADLGEALVALTRLRSGPSHHTAPVRIVGLDPDRAYEVRLLDVSADVPNGARRQPAWLSDKLRMTGRQLAAAGFAAPQLHPETGILVHLSALPSTP